MHCTHPIFSCQCPLYPVPVQSHAHRPTGKYASGWQIMLVKLHGGAVQADEPSMYLCKPNPAFHYRESAIMESS